MASPGSRPTSRRCTKRSTRRCCPRPSERTERLMSDGEHRGAQPPTIAFAGPLAVHRSRKLIPPFRLHRPTNIAEAVAVKAAAGPGAVFMAGGIDVVSRMKFGAPVTDLIHLG